MDFKNTKIVRTEHAFHIRLFLEAWYSIWEKSAGNNHSTIPAIFQSTFPSHPTAFNLETMLTYCNSLFLAFSSKSTKDLELFKYLFFLRSLYLSTGKTYTLLSDGGVTTRLVSHCFDRIRQDEIHNYRVSTYSSVNQQINIFLQIAYLGLFKFEKIAFQNFLPACMLVKLLHQSLFTKRAD